MKMLLLAGLLSAAAPAPEAAETVAACQAEKLCPAGEPRTLAQAPAASARPRLAQPAPQPRTSSFLRRRSGKPIPDAELIGPRGAL